MVLTAQAEPVHRGAMVVAEFADKWPFSPGTHQLHLAATNAINAVCYIACPVDKIYSRYTLELPYQYAPAPMVLLLYANKPLSRARNHPTFQLCRLTIRGLHPLQSSNAQRDICWYAPPDPDKTRPVPQKSDVPAAQTKARVGEMDGRSCVKAKLREKPRKPSLR